MKHAAATIASALALVALSGAASAHEGAFIISRTVDGQLQIEYPWSVPTFLDEVLPPYRGDAFKISVERVVIPNVGLNKYPPFQGSQIYIEVIATSPSVHMRDGGQPSRIILGTEMYYCGPGDGNWANKAVWMHADQFHPSFDWNAFEWYLDIRAVDLAGLHTPSFTYRTKINIEHYCAADLTASSIPGTLGYGEPDGTVDNEDFFIFLTYFSQGAWQADRTTVAVPGAPGYGDQDGLVTNDDFFYFLSEFVAGCRI